MNNVDSFRFSTTIYAKIALPKKIQEKSPGYGFPSTSRKHPQPICFGFETFELRSADESFISAEEF